MDVLVDTSVWSLALSLQAEVNAVEKRLTAALGDLIRDDRARLIGPIRQELLSGIRDQVQYERIKGYLRPFPDEALFREDYEHAARCCNQCRSRGITGSGVDFLICAVALDRSWQILTADVDFRSYSKVLSIQLLGA
ncbi:MAG TPA: PIN domain-containing protein [Bryobacteraceae bacterium]|nr:PIN domain-containing protein [Bryobacteraceae bacterium]